MKKLLFISLNFLALNIYSQSRILSNPTRLGLGTSSPTAILGIVNTNTATLTFSAIGSGTVIIGYNGALTIKDGSHLKVEAL